MRSLLLRLIAPAAAGALVASGVGLAQAGAADQPFGSLPCISDQLRPSLVTDVLFWQFDAMSAACTDRFKLEGTIYWKGEFNRVIEPWRQKTYAVVAYEVFGPLYGDQAPKARLQFLTDLTQVENPAVFERLTEDLCKDVTEDLYLVANEATSLALGPRLEAMVADAVRRSVDRLPRCSD